MFNLSLFNGYPVTGGVVAVVTRSKTFISWDESFRPCDCHSDDTASHRITVAGYEHMRKWMVKFRNKFESRDFKFFLVNLIHIPKSVYLL